MRTTVCLATRRIEMDDPDQLPTERIEVGDETIEETAEWVDDTEIESTTVREETPLAAMAPRARRVFERLRRAGVKSRRHRSDTLVSGENRRRDTESAERFDRALRKLTEGDLEAAFYSFTELLEERPQSTRLWIFVRAISQAKAAEK